MSKPAHFAREDVMEAYLDGLLREVDTPEESTEVAARLLEQASVVQADITPDIESVEVPDMAFEQSPQIIADVEAAQQEEPVAQGIATASLQDMLEERFQALFFEVAGLTLAVPLITLGGIHQLEKVGPLIGKPKWFRGVMLHRDEKINVVDTAMWVMPEKYDQTLANKLNYQYLIMLGDSAWGLASDKLVNNVTLNKSDIQWREAQGKRPWLAGMVKERMCALIDVEQLISMLNNGLGSKDQMP